MTSSLKTRTAALTAAALAGLVYLNALDNPFVYDDFRTIIDNNSILSLTDWRPLLLHDLTRPVVNVSYAIDYSIWGDGPFGFHVTNVLLHMLNVWLLFQLSSWLIKDRQRKRQPGHTAPVSPTTVGFAAAALLAVHPMMSESVGYISSRAEVLCATLFLGGFLSARRWMLRGGVGWWLLSMTAWVIAMATKELGVALPFLLLIYDRLVLDGDREQRRRRLLRFHVPFVSVALLAALTRLLIFVQLEHADAVSIAWRGALTELDVIRRYLALIAFPRGQSIYHAVPPVTSILALSTLTSAGLVALILALAWRLRRANSVASLGLIWFLLLLVPSSLLFVFNQGDAMAEHRVYLASGGLFLTTGAGVGWLMARVGKSSSRLRWLLGCVFAIALVPLAGRTLLRNATWSSPVTLWQEASNLAPMSWTPRTVLGESLHAAGRHEEAIAALRDAILLDPEEETGYVKLALCLSESSRFDEATTALEDLRKLKPSSALVPTGLGIVRLMSGDPEHARTYFRDAVVRDPEDLMARQWLSTLEEQFGSDPAEALRLCQEIQRLAPASRGNDECVRRNQRRLAIRPAGP